MSYAVTSPASRERARRGSNRVEIRGARPRKSLVKRVFRGACPQNLLMALFLVVGGCCAVDPFPGSGRCRLYVSKGGDIVDKAIDRNSRNGKWCFSVYIDGDASFGVLWKTIEERWMVAEDEWDVICYNNRRFTFTPGDECDRMYGSLVAFRHVDIEFAEEGEMRIIEEGSDYRTMSSAPVCVLLRCPRSISITKVIDITTHVLRQYNFVVRVFIKPIDLPVHGEFPAPWLDGSEKKTNMDEG